MVENALHRLVNVNGFFSLDINNKSLLTVLYVLITINVF